MAAHSSILAWRIPWTEEPGRLQYMGQNEPDIKQKKEFKHNTKDSHQITKEESKRRNEQKGLQKQLQEKRLIKFNEDLLQRGASLCTVSGSRIDFTYPLQAS